MAINTKKYIEQFLQIRTKSAEVVPLRLNAPQQKLYAALAAQARAGKPLRAIVLKARQMGFSTLTEAMIFKRTATRKNVRSGIVAHDEDATNNLYRMTKLFYERLPEPMQPQRRALNARELVFNDAEGHGLNSSIRVMTAGGKGVGRAINSKLYALISDDDFRKHSWLDPGLFDYYEYKSCRPDYKEFFDPNSAASTKLPGSLVAIKFRPGQGNYTTYTVGNAVDHPLMRVEEMYLIEAEATAASNLSNGIALLNSFMQTYRYASYNCQSADFKAFQNEIGLQARIEFWGEGIPFWYKKRLALGIDLANSNCKEDSYRFVVDGRAPWWNCQIPRTEWSSNPALIGMNNPDPSDTVENVIE